MSTGSPSGLSRWKRSKNVLQVNLIQLFLIFGSIIVIGCCSSNDFKSLVLSIKLVRFFTTLLANVLRTYNKLIPLSPATAQAPKFIREIKDVRTKEGMRGKFEAGFAGHPKPDITWWFNGQQLQNSKNIQIKIRDDSTVLHIIDCGFDLAGYYECKAESDMGKDKCRASLTVNSK